MTTHLRPIGPAVIWQIPRTIFAARRIQYAPAINWRKDRAHVDRRNITLYFSLRRAT